MRTKPMLMAMGVSVAVLCVAAFWRVGWMNGQAEEARRNHADLADCRVFAERIERFDSGGEVATGEEMEQHDLGSLAEAAFTKARVPGKPIKQIDPTMQARRVGRTSYLIKPTTITVRGVTRTQLIEAMYYLTEGTKLSVRDLTLSAPRSTQDHRVWDADVTLTYLIYDKPTGTDGS